MSTLIEAIFNGIEKSIKQFSGEIPEDIETYLIGSGSNFIIHKNISLNKAHKIYEEYKKNLGCLGTRISIKNCGSAILEDWHTLESNSGHTFTFMFKISNIIEHDPNDVIEEWQQRKKEIEEFNKKLEETITKKFKKTKK